jgi:hypothetical protein
MNRASHLAEEAPFARFLKGHDFSRANKRNKISALYRLLKNSL